MAAFSQAAVAAKTDEHYTPKEIWQPALSLLGSDKFGMDPCSNSKSDPNVPADILYTKEDDSLTIEWPFTPSIWCNPPYSLVYPFTHRCINAAEYGSEVFLLTKADPSTAWFQLIWHHSQCVLFFKKRIRFINPDNQGNSAMFPSSLAYFGSRFAEDNLSQIVGWYSHLAEAVERIR